MESNSTKPTIRELFILFSQNMGQAASVLTVEAKISTTGNDIWVNGIITRVDITDCEIFVSGEDGYEHKTIPGAVVLIKKSLGEISDEHIEVLAELFDMNEFTNRYTVDEKQKYIRRCITAKVGDSSWLPEYAAPRIQQAIDLLREWGYGTPYKKWSVEELVQAGIFKIIDNENKNSEDFERDKIKFISLSGSDLTKTLKNTHHQIKK